jgi:hypothetical protein
VTLTNEWRGVYNDALLILGLDEITSNNDDSNRRAKLDRVVSTGIVANELESTHWSFGRTSTKSFFDPSIEPAFGYPKVHAVPPDLHIFHGIYQDEFMQVPLKYYKYEDGKLFTEHNEIYIEYISTTFLTNPAQWRVYYRKLIAARLACDAAKSLNLDPAESKVVYKDRLNSAQAIDAQESPPRLIAKGNWTGTRFKEGDRNRPGGG